MEHNTDSATSGLCPQPVLDLLEIIAKSLVADPTTVRVVQKVGNPSTIVELQVAKEDIGKVIGRQGRTAEAMRTVLNCSAAKHNLRCLLHIVEPDHTLENAP
jgi:uncharacterized protein